jgi:hypothetical protein
VLLIVPPVAGAVTKMSKFTDAPGESDEAVQLAVVAVRVQPAPVPVIVPPFCVSFTATLMAGSAPRFLTVTR